MTRQESQFDALLQAARGGDRDALGQLLDDFRPYLLLFADRNLGLDLKPKCGNSDLVQQTFLDAQQAFARFDGVAREELLAWLERILVNNAADVARQFRQTAKRQIKREVPLAESGPELEKIVDPSTPSNKVAADEETERLREALTRLPDDYRQVIVLRNLDRRPFEEIATVMERSEGAVKKLWSRAIGRLVKELRPS